MCVEAGNVEMLGARRWIRCWTGCSIGCLVGCSTGCSVLQAGDGGDDDYFKIENERDNECSELMHAGGKRDGGR